MDLRNVTPKRDQRTKQGCVKECKSDVHVDVYGGVREVAAEFLSNLSADAPLMEAGLDSLGAVEFRNRLAERLGEAVALPETLIFDFPTLRQLEAHLSTQVRPHEPAGGLSTGGIASDFSPALLAALLPAERIARCACPGGRP